MRSGGFHVEPPLVASDYEDEYYEWVQTEGFRNELRNNSEFARYVGVQ